MSPAPGTLVARPLPQARPMAQERPLGAFVVRLVRVAGRLEVAVLDLRDGDVSRWRDPEDAWQRLLRDVPGGPAARPTLEDPDADPNP